MKDAIQELLATNLLAYYRYAIYQGDFVRSAILLLFFIIILISSEKGTTIPVFLFSVALISAAITVGMFINRTLPSGRKFRTVITIGESLLAFISFLGMFFITNKHIVENFFAFSVVLPAFELLFYFITIPLIALYKDFSFRAFLKTFSRLFALFVLIPELVLFSVPVLYFTSPFASHGELDSPLTLWINYNTSFLSFVQKNLLHIVAVLVSITGDIVVPQLILKIKSSYSHWPELQGELLDNFEVWIKQKVTTPRKKVKINRKFPWRKNHKTIANIEENIDEIIFGNGSGEIQRLWDLLKFFSDKLDKTVKDIIAENNIYPLLNNSRDGDKKVRELFDSAIIMFFYQSRKDTGFRLTDNLMAQNFSPHKNWHTHLALTHPYSWKNYDILNRVFAELNRKNRNSTV